MLAKSGEAIVNCEDKRSMSYPGGKSGAGVYQTIINQIPPHETYIEAFAGGGAILCLKKPAATNIAIDIDPAGLDLLRTKASRGTIFLNTDAVLALQNYSWTGKEFVYCDPPYLMETRSTKRRLYRFEFSSEEQHRSLLSCLQAIPADIMISGYPNALYDDILRKWRKLTFSARTRRGMAIECLWMNYPEPVLLHDYRYLGRSFRERERIKRRQARWKKRLMMMSPLERAALLEAIEDLHRGALANAIPIAGRPSPDRPLYPGTAMPESTSPFFQ
jgi:DNA adenine methylase